MIPCNNSRDLTDCRKPAICQVAARHACLILLSLQVLGSDCLRAQPAFAPPPPPSAPQLSEIRNSAESPQPSPTSTTLAPPPTQIEPFVPSPPSSETSPTSPAGAQPLEGGEIVARVDGQIVLASEVLWQVNQIFAANRDRMQHIPPDELEKLRRNLLRQQTMGLIDTKLLYADFRRTVPAENISKIEENLRKPFEEHEIPRLIKVLKVKDRRELVDLLESFGSSLEDVRRQFNERTIAGEWLRQKAPKPQPVTHEQMLEYYQEHLEQYSFPAQAKWEELMVRFDRFGGDRAAAWRAIAEIGNEVWQRVVEKPDLRGPVFVEIAKKKSHGFTAEKGGQHDWTTRGAMRSEAIDEALFSLQVGQLSNIIETESGFHIIRVLERKEAGRTSFEEAQAEIRKVLEGQHKKGLAEAELVKLRKQSSVCTVFDGDLSGPKLAEMLQKRQRR